MPVLRGFVDRARGVVYHVLRDQVAAGVDVRVHEMLDAAVQRWCNEGWPASDMAEDDCTVQLHKHCLAIAHEDGRFAFMDPTFNWVYLTEGMLAGKDPVKKAKRPDLRISIGKVAGRAVECKRLALKGGLTKDYVEDGMGRFVRGEYAPSEPIGYMIGYAREDELDDLVRSINGHVETHALMGATHQLQPTASTVGAAWHHSHHTRTAFEPIDLDHLLIKVA